MGGRSGNAGMELHLLLGEFFSGKKISLYIMDHGQQVCKIPVCVSVLTGSAVSNSL